MGDRLRAGIPSQYVTSQLGQLSLASLRGCLSSTSVSWGKGENVTSAGWQVTLCDPVWHVSSRSGVATLRTAIHSSLTYLLTSMYSAPVPVCLSHYVDVNKYVLSFVFRLSTPRYPHRMLSAGACSFRSMSAARAN